MKRTRRRGGFTLIEVIVALVIGAMILVGARALLVQIADSADAIAREGRLADASANGDRQLRAIIRQADVGAEADRLFTGDARSIQFKSWCELPSGWSEPCSIVLALNDRGRDNLDIIAHLSTGLLVRVAVGGREGVFIYRSDSPQGGRWLRSWERGSTAPLAIGLASGRDTLIYRIGGRG